MPALPTITVTDAQAARMLKAYGSTDKYIQWLIDSIIEHVTNTEIQALQDADRQKWLVQAQKIRTELTSI